MEKSDNDTSATWLGSTIDEIKDKYEASSLNAVSLGARKILYLHLPRHLHFF